MMDLVTYRPFSIPSLFGDMERFFNGPSLFRHVEDEGRNLVPKVDVSEDENAYTIRADVPGYAKDEVKVEVNDGGLTLSAEHKEEKEEKKENFHIRERRFGSFTRTFVLPDDADVEKIEAKVKDGILTVNVPKAEARKPRQIAVNAQ